MEKDTQTLSGWLETYRNNRYETLRKGSSKSINPSEENPCGKRHRLEKSKGLVQIKGLIC